VAFLQRGKSLSAQNSQKLLFPENAQSVPYSL
jgi:hypothetical protein